jgi:hypothetical protein
MLRVVNLLRTKIKKLKLDIKLKDYKIEYLEAQAKVYQEQLARYKNRT